MLAVALKEAFRTALTGRCDAKPELADSPHPAQHQRPGAALPRRRRRWPRGLFEPLGWTVETTSEPLQPEEWGPRTTWTCG